MPGGLNAGQVEALFTEAELLQELANIKARLKADPNNYTTAWGAEGKTASLGREMSTGNWLALVLEALSRKCPAKYSKYRQPDRGGTAFDRTNPIGIPDWIPYMDSNGNAVYPPFPPQC